MSIADVSSQWKSLEELTTVIKKLSEQKCVKDLESLLRHADTLNTKMLEHESTIKSQDEKLKTMSNEVIRLQSEHKDRQQEVIETHSTLLRKRDDEKFALKQALTRQEEELSKAKHGTQDLQEHMQVLDDEINSKVVELENKDSQLKGAHIEVENLKKSLKEQSSQLRQREQEQTAEKKARNDLKSQLEALQKQCAELEQQLKAKDKELRQIEELAPPLLDDNVAEASKSIQKVWKQCFHLGQVCFREGNPLEQLRDPSNWRDMRMANQVTYAVPLAPTNSPAAKRMRFFATLAILSDSLVRNLFTSTHVFSKVDEIDRLMIDTADADQRKEALFRRLLNSMSTGIEDDLLEERLKKITDDVAGRIEPLLSTEQNDKMRSDLTEVLKLATEVWKSLQKRQSYFTVESIPPSESSSTWKSLVWDDEKKVLSEQSTKAPKDVVLILFPRIIMLNPNGEREIFPGVVLLKAETATAHVELGELPASPTLNRTGTNRSLGGRRSTAERRSESGSFLAQNGT